MSDIKESDTLKMSMPAAYRLQRSKNGTNTIEFEREFRIRAGGYFKDLRVIFTKGEQPWMDPDARYVHTVVRVKSVRGEEVTETVKVAFPKEEDDPDEYHHACKQRDRFEDLQKEYQKQAPRMIEFLLDGCMDAETRKRVMSLVAAQKNPILDEIMEKNQVLRLKKIMIGAWDFKGMASNEKDKEKAEDEFRAWKKKLVDTGKSVKEHKDDFDEQIRKLTSLGSIGNTDPRDDEFTQKSLFEAFTQPLRTHFHVLVRNRVQQYVQKIPSTLDKDDPEEIDREYAMFLEFEKEDNISAGGKLEKGGFSNNSVHSTKEEKGKGDKKSEKGKVNSAQASVQREVNRKIERDKKKADTGKKGPFITEKDFPNSWKKANDIKEKEGCTLVEAMRKFTCFNCNLFGHLSDEPSVLTSRKRRANLRLES